MASISTDKAGRKRVQFISPTDHKRKTVRLGVIPDAAAKEVADHLDHLISMYHTPQFLSKATIAWLKDLPTRLYTRISRTGLVPPRADTPKAPAMTLGRFLDKLFAAMTVKASTHTAYGHMRANMETYFGKDRPLQDEDGEDNISPEEVDTFRAWLTSKKGAGLSPATAARRIIAARQFFKRAVRWGYLKSNPLTDVRGGAQRNEKRNIHIPRDIIQKVIDACPNAQWRLIIALARYGALRTPSEIYPLTWSDVDWEKRQIFVRSPKTEHHEGRDSRIIPLYPELEPYLQAVYDEADEGTEHVITRYREGNANLRTHFHRIIRRAGLQPWPRLFQNLRSSRETELFETYPIEVACRWTGNSPVVAVSHYLNDPNKDAHFRRAAGFADGGKKAAQKAAHFLEEVGGSSGKVNKAGATKTPENAAQMALSGVSGMGAAGFEPA